MRRDSKLSGVLHVLLHMAEIEGPVTSEFLAGVMQTNPVVVRRIMAGLRDRGYVRSEKGHGGGWRIACDFGAVTLRDINAAMDESFREAEALLMAQLGRITLAALSADFHARLAACGGDFNLETAHA